MNDAVLVIGSGLAGVRASVELLQQRFRVYLLERGPSVGAKMAICDRLFPPNEHGSCAFQPSVFELTSNPNVTIFTSSRMLSLEGQTGDFKVTIIKKQIDAKESLQSIEFTVGAVIVTEALDIEISNSLDQLGIEIDDKGYPRGDSHSHHPCRTHCDGVFKCCTKKEPEAIEDLIIQACAAAANTAALLCPARGVNFPPSVEVGLQLKKVLDKPKIAVVVDRGDVSVSDIINLDELCEYTRSLPNVECVELTLSSYDGLKITELLKTGHFNRLVIAGPSPIINEYFFQRHAENAGLNCYLLEIVNLHSQCAAVHLGDKTVATNKAKTLMKMGVARARLLEPIEELRVSITQSCLVVGGSMAGLSCAAKLAEMGLQVEIVERISNLAEVPGNDHPLVSPLVDRCLAGDHVRVHTDTRIASVDGRMGDFKVCLIRNREELTVEVGAIVITTVMDAEKEIEEGGIEKALALRKGDDGFYLSTEGSLNLLDFDTAGVFNCGPARGAVTTEDAVVEGEAAASRVACIITSNSMSRPPTISNVVDKNCDGCAYCVDPCPTRSITLLEFMLRGEIKKVVEVSERTCIGCGICMSTCPKKGIDVKHYKLEYFSEMIKAALENKNDQPLIVSFCCNRCAYPAADATGLAGIQYPANIFIIRTVCLGMIHPNIIIDTLTQGADGVLMCGCHPGNCRSREGIRKALDRKEAIELMLEDFGLELERFRLEHIAASEGLKFAQVVKEMTDELSTLRASPYRQSL